MNTQLPDQQLVKLVQQGNKAAFNVLVQKHQYRVTGLISRYINNSADAADITQEAFIKAYRAISYFKGDSAFYTWLYRIAVNTAKNWLTAKYKQPITRDIEDNECQKDDSLLIENASPEHLMATDELQQVIFNTIEELPIELKTAIQLRELDGLSYEEIANISQCPVGTVRSRIFRARKAIDKNIKPLLKY